ncbi:MAG TPA: hypothetical protein VJC37_04835, partial [Planctomycetota bacterium]|nr:hypothetical protein [Planctomycetota bacterium]
GRQAVPARPQLRPTVKMPAAGVKPPTTIRPPVKGMGIKPSGLKKGLPTRKPAGDSDEEGMNGLEIKKKSKTPLFIGIGIGVVILVFIIIALSSGGGKSAEEEAMLKKVTEEAKEKEKAEAEEAEKAAKKSEEENKAAAEKPAPEMRKEPPEAKKPAKASKPKIKDEIDAAIKTEIEPILKNLRNQRDDEQKPSKEKIMAHGKKAMPILIEAIGGADDWAAMYAYEMLLKMTKRNPDDTQKVSQMIGKDARIDCQKDWEEWWFKNKESIPE